MGKVVLGESKSVLKNIHTFVGFSPDGKCQIPERYVAARTGVSSKGDTAGLEDSDSTKRQRGRNQQQRKLKLKKELAQENKVNVQSEIAKETLSKETKLPTWRAFK